MLRQTSLAPSHVTQISLQGLTKEHIDRGVCVSGNDEWSEE